MSDFFYYGQKDMIRRLNELAGRGAVVASYAPKVGMSPVGGPNGFMDPAWLDPAKNIVAGSVSAKNIMANSILGDINGAGTTVRTGYNYTSNGENTHKFIRFATLSADSDSNLQNIRIRGILNDGWSAAGTAVVDILLGNRGGLNVTWSIEGYTPMKARFIVIKRTDGLYDVYAFTEGGSWATLSFEVSGIQTPVLDRPVISFGLPETGVIVFDTSARFGNDAYITPIRRTSHSPLNRKTTVFPRGVYVGHNESNATAMLGSERVSVGQNEGTAQEVLSLGVVGKEGHNYPGRFGVVTEATTGFLYANGFKLRYQAWDTQLNSWSPALMEVRGNGQVYVGTLKAGSADGTPRHTINRTAAQGAEILQVGREGLAQPCVAVNGSDGSGGWAASPSVLYVGKHSATGRSVGTAGTINAQGNDYAEYMPKCLSCSDVRPGQIIGITANNEIVDTWTGAIMFAIKSTDPSFVGGDDWARELGIPPSPQAGDEPVRPMRLEGVMDETSIPEGTGASAMATGDTDEEWEAKLHQYRQAMLTWALSVQEDADVMREFNDSLEVARARVDRIAIAGRVPVNVLGAQPGDYIVAVQDGAGIGGIAVHEDELTDRQYRKALGRVISIEPDGRAYVMVKAV